MTQFKICGLCRPVDAAAAVAAGARYVGVILSSGHRRSQTLQGAAAIFSASPTARRVGVFVNPVPAAVLEAVRALDLDVVQLHGDESPDLAQELMAHADVWKALCVRSSETAEQGAAAYAGCVSGLLLDGYDAAVAGGSGISFDWREVVEARRRLPSELLVVVAGGLVPENVGAAIDALRPDVVDVSSGVEHAVGEKSVELVQAFARAVSTASSLPVT